MPVMTLPKRTYILRASTADGATNITGATQKNGQNYKGVKVTINLATITGTSVTFTLQGLDPISGNALTTDLLASAAKSSAGTFSLTIYPGAVAVANSILNDTLPIWWRIKTTGTYTVCTWSAYAELIP